LPHNGGERNIRLTSLLTMSVRIRNCIGELGKMAPIAQMDFATNSRRSTVYSTKGMVSSTQPLANSAGLNILNQGGNCVDACVAMAACLCVLEPTSTGIGGDCFALFYKNSDKKVYGMNGTGRAAGQLSIDWLKDHRPDEVMNTLRLKEDSVFKVTVPGAIAGWQDSVERWGSGEISFKNILQPAIDLCKNGYPVSQISAYLWKCGEKKLLKENSNMDDLKWFLPNVNGTEAPKKGQFMKNLLLAETLEEIAQNGKDAFYKGDIGRNIVDELTRRGHVMSLDDLSNHTSTFVNPISYEFLEHKLWEIPPNGSGIIALITLGLMKNLEKANKLKLSEMKHNSAEYLHLLIECLKISFIQSEEYVSDYDHYREKTGIDQHSFLKEVLGDEYLTRISEEFSADKILENSKVLVPNPMFKSDTVYFTATDSEGNACSFINSLYDNFGSGIIVPERGFALHNRGGNFSLNPHSKNSLEGGKRPYHTIIPGMITIPISTSSAIADETREELYATYGIMGGYNQPQAHVQVYLNMLLFGMDPQEALDAPRISLFSHPDYKHTDRGCGSDGPASSDVTCVGIEDGISADVVKELEKIGHQVRVVSGYDRKMMGRGQIIRKESKPEDDFIVFAGGSDLRGDGASAPQV
jgi:gamma-glutamyltranspeptidase/glutathione hydrolase